MGKIVQDSCRSCRIVQESGHFSRKIKVEILALSCKASLPGDDIMQCKTQQVYTLLVSGACTMSYNSTTHSCEPDAVGACFKVTMYYLIKFFAGNFAALYLRNYNRY